MRKRFPCLCLVIVVFCMGVLPIFAEKGVYLDKALQAAEWIKSHTVKTPHGITWPAEPAKPESVKVVDLYSGSPGVVLFFLETYYATGSSQYLEDACKGADHLLVSLPTVKEVGLYTGIAGIGFVLEETFKATGKQKYRKGVRQCVRLIQERAITKGKGIQWNDLTDIIYGNAGIGLFLLYIAEELKDPGIYDLAVRAGIRLKELGIRAANGSGIKWKIAPGSRRFMPNFSHGTAGIAYFLAALYKETKKKEFLDAALGGAKYLLSIAKKEGDVCLVFHHTPGGEDLFYLGWCHGPVGTARLFYLLYEVTGDRTWLDWVKRGARGIMQSGIPEKQTPGSWNNVGRCCGLAGVAEFFLDLHREFHDPAYIDFSKRVAQQILKKAEQSGKGLRWVQAEHRVKPGLLAAQTGLMQGAAGIGLWLLKLHAFEKGKREKIFFPDSPF